MDGSKLRIETAFLDAMVRSVDKSKKVFRREFIGGLLQPIVQHFVRLNFDAGGRPKKWPKLQKYYKRRKVRQGHSSKILVRTGQMRAAVTERLHVTVKGNEIIFRAPGRSAGLVEIHSRGMVAGGRGAPKVRPVLQITSGQQKRLVKMVESAYEQAVKIVEESARTGRIQNLRLRRE